MGLYQSLMCDVLNTCVGNHVFCGRFVSFFDVSDNRRIQKTTSDQTVNKFFKLFKFLQT